MLFHNTVRLCRFLETSGVVARLAHFPLWRIDLRASSGGGAFSLTRYSPWGGGGGAARVAVCAQVVNPCERGHAPVTSAAAPPVARSRGSDSAARAATRRLRAAVAAPDARAQVAHSDAGTTQSSDSLNNLKRFFSARYFSCDCFIDGSLF